MVAGLQRQRCRLPLAVDKGLIAAGSLHRKACRRVHAVVDIELYLLARSTDKVLLIPVHVDRVGGHGFLQYPRTFVDELSHGDDMLATNMRSSHHKKHQQCFSHSIICIYHLRFLRESGGRMASSL